MNPRSTTDHTSVAIMIYHQKQEIRGMESVVVVHHAAEIFELPDFVLSRKRLIPFRVQVN